MFILGWRGGRVVPTKQIMAPLSPLPADEISTTLPKSKGTENTPLLKFFFYIILNILSLKKTEEGNHIGNRPSPCKVHLLAKSNPSTLYCLNLKTIMQTCK